MNLVSLVFSLVVTATSVRFVAVLATTLQLAGLLLCATATSTLQILLGFGGLVGVGVGLTLVNNIILVKKQFKATLSTAFAVACSTIALLGIPLPELLDWLGNLLAVQHTETGQSLPQPLLAFSLLRDHSNITSGECNVNHRADCLMHQVFNMTVTLMSGSSCLGYLGAALMKGETSCREQCREMSHCRNTAEKVKTFQKMFK